MNSYRPTGEIVLDIVGRVEGIPPWRIRGSERTLDVLRARTMAVYVMRKVTPYTQAQIGRVIGRTDHSTVSNLIARAQKLKESDERFAKSAVSIIGQVYKDPRLIKKNKRQRSGDWTNEERICASFLHTIGRSSDEIAWVLGRKDVSVTAVLRTGSAKWPPSNLGPISTDPEENDQFIAMIFDGRKFEDIRFKEQAQRMAAR